MKLEIFGIKFDNLTINEVLKKIEQFLKSEKQHYIVLPYSEFIVRAQKDMGFKKILNKADLCLCEGRGLWLVAKLIGKRLKENIYGVNLINSLILLSEANQRLTDKSQTVFSPSINPSISKTSKAGKLKLFLLGGKENVAKKTKEKLGEQIVGYANGYQDLRKVIEKINKIKPNILLVGLGSPKQEKWIYKNLKKMPSIKLAIGIGGAFDFISGRIKRAPKFIQKIGLEWLWRLILQPWRIKRIYNGVIKFSWLIVKCKILKK